MAMTCVTSSFGRPALLARSMSGAWPRSIRLSKSLGQQGGCTLVHLRCRRQSACSGTLLVSIRNTLTYVASAASSPAPVGSSGMGHEHIMLALLDQNPYLSDGSKQAVAAAVSFGQSNNSKITVTLLEGESLAEEDRKKRVETVMWHFQQAGFSNFGILEKEAGKASVTIGDVADLIAANMVIMSVEPIHAKLVDANLLAEFVPCPMLLVP